MLKPDTSFPSRIQPSSSPSPTTTRATPDELHQPINVSSFPHDDLMWKRKKFNIVLDVYKPVDSDNARVRDINPKSA